MTDDRDDELAREIRSHLELEAEEREADGLSEGEARYAARRAFGNVTRAQEEVRALRNNPAFAAVSILTLALGIAATTSVFSIVRGVLLQPPPFKDADRIVQIIENVPAEESFSGQALRRPSMDQDEFDWWRTET